MRSKSLVASITLALVAVNVQVAHADDENVVTRMIQDCAITPDTTCIKTISAITDSGSEIKATLTGRTSSDYSTGPNFQDDEYSLPGLNFESPAQSNFIVRIFEHATWLQLDLEPSWIDYNQGSSRQLAIITPHRPTSNYCGPSDNPFPCQRALLFNQHLLFKVTLQIPKASEPAYIAGYTTALKYSYGTNARVIQGTDYEDLSLTMDTSKREFMLYSNLLPDPLSTSQYADYEIDRPVVNVFSASDPNAQTLGKCSGIPTVSVISNGINPDVPVWDPNSQTIGVNLSGPHFKVNGDLNTGFFEATISKAMGECLWGINLGNETQAIVNLTDDSGGEATKVETIVSHMEGNNFVLTDANFHYSSPHFAIKLQNLTLVQPPATTLPAKIIKTIKCKKGNSTKVLSVVNPTCPKGYQRLK